MDTCHALLSQFEFPLQKDFEWLNTVEDDEEIIDKEDLDAEPVKRDEVSLNFSLIVIIAHFHDI
jgi:hypothetical protein